MLPASVAFQEGSMDRRAAIEGILDKAYAARQRNDAEGAAACFTEDGCFCANGGPATTNRTEQTMALKAQFEAFALLDMKMHCRIIRRGPWSNGGETSVPRTGRWVRP